RYVFGIARGFRLGYTRAELDAAAFIANLDARRLQGFERYLIIAIGNAYKSVERGRLLLQDRRENVHEGGFGQKDLVVGARPDLDLPQHVAVMHDEREAPGASDRRLFRFRRRWSSRGSRDRWGSCPCRRRSGTSARDVQM